MHDQIARAEALRLGQEIFGTATFLGLADQTVAQHILLGDDGQIRCLEPVFQRPNRQMQSARAQPRCVGDRDHLCQTFVFDQPR